MASARSVERAFSPLDNELALLPGYLTPSLQAWLVRLSAWMPFAHSASLLSEFAHVPLSEGTAQRLTLAAGAVALSQQTDLADHLIEKMPPALAGPDCLLISVDGCMVPLLHGEWAEVKTMVLGEVDTESASDGNRSVQTQQISSFSRLTDASNFATLATVESYARGIERAGTVVAVTDGAEWIQGFLDVQCPNAQRILDFPHAAQRLSAIATLVWGEGDGIGLAWQSKQRQTLKQEGPAAVLAEIQALQAADPGNQALAEHAAYLSKRQGMMDYPRYQAALWPIGSGSVESANKLVVEARLKGAGMHWERSHVNPMLVLRNIVCNERWHQVWPQIAAGLRKQAPPHRQALPKKVVPVPAQPQPMPIPEPVKQSGIGKAHPLAANHPWKRPACPGGLRHNLAQRAAATT